MEPPEDLSSLVKVEMEEGFGPVIDTTTTTTATARTSSSSAATYTPSPPPHPSGSRLPLPPGLLPHFPPPPPLSRISADPFASGHHPKEMPNMFHFGDVSVNHHPDTPPVPMVIPMVYLYPLPSNDQGKSLSFLNKFYKHSMNSSIKYSFIWYQIILQLLT